MSILLQLLVNGLLLGGAYAIISIGLTLIFGVVRVVNFAHGELLMVGMYAVWLLAAKLGWHPYVSAVPVALLLFAFGVLIQRFIIQPLLSADAHIQIFATVGVSTALVNLALMIFGADVHPVDVSFGTEHLQFGDINIVSGQVITFAAALAVAGGLHLFLQRTYTGRAFRAVAQHRYAASLMGVNVKTTYVLAFGIGAALVGLASGLLVAQYPVFPTVGQYFVLTAFVIVVLGGLGSLPGALVGSIVIGLIDSLAGYYISPDMKEVVYFAIFLVILVVRPTGLFGLGRGSE
ncbi:MULTISPECIES: branched-chain amino acid ABC transporter permease [unclassified Caballeronia]|uniref:branched-chain amino acid ABC transporter permease n=1 Tax=unclassified Caballeronia TaxID=2646786 RepID=UPI002027BBFA|nr:MULTISPECIES: branched-chain amino acid ABC transporter permease [unclassified Caballeronia]MDR5767595.1 branched-chain amino acid ABC transporter permease [Caballeronia sp. LZ028]